MEPVVYLTSLCGLQGKVIPKPTSPEAEEGRDVYNFRGIPYAEPPVGSLRFCDPKPVSLWSGVRSATEFGAVCPQDFSTHDLLPFAVPRPESVSEDCLFLNVWTPSLDSEARLPVMVWIYGGGFVAGYSDLYDVKALSCFHNVVVVTFNYRVASFGFLCLNDDAAAGNYGIMDQIEALKWVRTFIAHFGGDPDNVTIFGESAGSISACLLTISPLAKGLFKRAIAQSGTTFTGDYGCRSPADAFSRLYAHIHIAKRTTLPGCPPAMAPSSEIVDFLRRQSTDELVTAFKDHMFTPVVDGRVFPARPAQLYERGDFNDCELIVGCNSDEGQMIYDMFVPKFIPPDEKLNVNVARIVVINIFKMIWTVPNADQVYEAVVDHYISAWPVDQSPEDLRKVMAECLGDFFFVIPTIQTASYHSRKCNTFVYHFCHRPPCASYPDYARADHFSEVYYALRMLGFGIDFKEDDVKLARQMATYWTNFARTGNPNGEGLEEWPAYNESMRSHLVLELPPGADSNLKGGHAEFWLHQLPKIIGRQSD